MNKYEDVFPLLYSLHFYQFPNNKICKTIFNRYNAANNRCKWSAAEFASELICLVMYNFYFSLIMTFFTASHSTHENPGEDIYNR
jgi:hypothetical protein